MIVVMEQHAGAGPTTPSSSTSRPPASGPTSSTARSATSSPCSAPREPASLREAVEAVAGVERVEATTRAFKLASRDVLPGGTTFDVGTVRIGGRPAIVVGTARPEPAGTLVALAREARGAGAEIFWAGRGEDGDLRHDLMGALGEIRSEVGLPTIVDVWEPGEIDRLSRNADALQIPAVQMQNVPLIRAAGRGDRPVFVRRGPSATIEEWLLTGERVLQEGNRKVALVEQGVRTFETAVQAMLTSTPWPWPAG